MSQITEKIKWAMSLRDPQFEALTFFDNISDKIDYRISSKEEVEKIASENCLHEDAASPVIWLNSRDNYHQQEKNYQYAARAK